MGNDDELFLQNDWLTNVLLWKTRGLELVAGNEIYLEILFAY